ncbi:DUF937 domain-containing protein [Streptomyces sp. NPDC050617]|uniref:DUF937 domain-containing protein n=1 Tax=Streptomyces sp. NPDC050617 TaxID=3154628 RepID=UPI0034353CDE
MTDDALHNDVIDALGNQRLKAVAGLLGTDTNEAASVVRAASTALKVPAAEVAAADEQPLVGQVTFGGFGEGTGGGTAADGLARAIGPVAKALANKTGRPETEVAAALRVIAPVLVTVLGRRSARR